MKLRYANHVVRVKITDPGDHIQKSWMKARFYETGKNGLLSWAYNNIKHRSIVLDVGANIGNHTLFFANAMNCRVHAFEPNPVAFAQLQDNVKMNGCYDRVKQHMCGLYDKDEEVGMQHVPGNLGMSRVEEGGSGFAVTMLDKLHPIPFKVSYIKLDCEGAEINALRGAKGFLGYQDHCFISCECAKPEELEECDSFLSELGYERLPIILNATPTYIWKK